MVHQAQLQDSAHIGSTDSISGMVPTVQLQNLIHTDRRGPTSLKTTVSADICSSGGIPLASLVFSVIGSSDSLSDAHRLRLQSVAESVPPLMPDRSLTRHFNNRCYSVNEEQFIISGCPRRESHSVLRLSGVQRSFLASTNFPPGSPHFLWWSVLLTVLMYLAR